MREDHIGDRRVLVLREPKPLPSEPHCCVTYHGATAPRRDNGAIIQCDCGKRYKCRPSRGLTTDESCVWVRRLLPWPPKQAWPKDNS